MTKKTIPHLDGVSETLLFPLVARAVESQRPDALIKDEKALAIVQQQTTSTWPLPGLALACSGR